MTSKTEPTLPELPFLPTSNADRVMPIQYERGGNYFNTQPCDYLAADPFAHWPDGLRAYDPLDIFSGTRQT